MTIDEMNDHADDNGRFSDGSGVAWRLVGLESVNDEDTVWTGIQVQTGRVLMVMVGDDRIEAIDPDYFEAIPEDDYCHECGQIGCTHDGRDR